MLRALSLLLLLFAAAPDSRASPPQINVGALFDYLAPGSSSQLKRIRNTGENTAYVRVEVTQMHFQDDGKVTETAVDAAALSRNESGSHGVIASPNRLIIAANGQQPARLIYRGPRDVERYYRLRFIPVAPNAEEFALSEEQARQAQAVSSTVQLFTGFGTVYFVAPANVRYQTRVEGTVVHNEGNATVVLDNLRYCERSRPDACSAGIIAHIRPGRSYQLQAGADQYSRYDIREGDTRRRIDSRR